MTHRLYTSMNTDKYFQVFCYLPEVEMRDSGLYVQFNSLVDLTTIENLRTQSKQSQRPNFTYTSILVQAIAQALTEMPYANQRVYRSPISFLTGPQRQSFTHIDIAVASELTIENTPSAAFVDVIRTVNNKSLTEITDWLQQLHQHDKTENKQLKDFKKIVDWLPARLAAFIICLPLYFKNYWVKYRGGSVVISSPGKYGVDKINGIWSWPIGFSFGFVKNRAIVKNDQLTQCPSFELTMSFDRRLMAGAPAAKFFKRVVDLVESGGLVHK